MYDIVEKHRVVNKEGQCSGISFELKRDVLFQRISTMSPMWVTLYKSDL